MRAPVRIGVVGQGGSADRLALSLAELPQADLRWICSAGPSKPVLGWRTQHSADFDELLGDELLDAIAIIAPVAARASLASAALEADKHVLVLGALSQLGESAKHLLDKARLRGRRLVSAHPELLDPGFRGLEALVDAGRLGDIFYLHGVRHVAGRKANDDSVLWTDGALEISRTVRLLRDEPVEVDAKGECYRESTGPELLDFRLRFANGIIAQLHVSALDPVPCARLSVVGSTCTAVLDETGSRPVALYAGEKQAAGLTSGSLTPGDMFSPQIPVADPWRETCEDFVTAVRGLASGAAEADRETAVVIDVLEALERSCAESQPIQLAAEAASRDLRLMASGDRPS